jgi:hypothetical protein
MGAQANSLWDGRDVDGWFALFRDDASFWIPGEGPLAGYHNKEEARAPVTRLMSAGGRWVIEQYKSQMGIASLFEQSVTKGADTIHYHGVDVYEFRPDDFDLFAGWILCPHEYPKFAAAWAAPADE